MAHYCSVEGRVLYFDNCCALVTHPALIRVPLRGIQIIILASFYGSGEGQQQDEPESRASHRSRFHTLQSTWPADVCSDWHIQHAAFHERMRAASRTGDRSLVKGQGTQQDMELRFATFSCAKLSRCGGVGDVLLGVFSAFLVAVLQGRALIINHPLVSATFDPAFVDWHMTEDINVDQPNTADEFEGRRFCWRPMNQKGRC